MSTGQTAFTAALLDPDAPVPADLADPQGRPAGRRFSVYRNNVAVSLTEALETAFPVLRKLVGDEFFAAMAGVFLRQHPPASPLMMHYGAEMPAFLEVFDPVKSLPYLPDIARLEIAIRQSYHAADSRPLAPEALQSLPPDQLMQARIMLAPALRLIRSDWPVHAIWAANMAGGPKPEMRPQAALVMRPGFDPVVICADQPMADFIDALLRGHPFAAALDAAGARFDLSAALTQLLEGRAMVGMSLEEQP